MLTLNYQLRDYVTKIETLYTENRKQAKLISNGDKV